ncbi:hypothetical protein CKO44_01480 [Rubrivivax gelatinosus]|uniref:hypothetical protein n=1 Tax=Rubrivivax gelatinosus TaxID=28068 RepID=UPI00190630FF|nr:hypothetical protein [Rubrivivax gelatinosus]MBK1612140.1 hypothetical protein [Rubrivivax gelatinosus]
MKTKQWALALILTAAMGAATARSVPLVEPERVLLPTTSQTQAPRSADSVRATIINGAQSLGWVVVKDEPGKLQLKYNKQNKHEVVIDAIYDAEGYQLKYVSSINMNYSGLDTGAEIHPGYNRWIANLIKTIGLVSQ